MIDSEPLLKTRQVADHLGVSDSTIKRWVDSGALRAQRTVGRHRLVPLSEALRFARERGLSGEGLARLAGLTGVRVQTIDDGLVERLSRSLRRGRADEVRELVRGAYQAGGGASMLGDRVIGPAMEQLGHDWQSGTLDVFQEHRATRIVEAALMELLRVAPPTPAEAPLALGAAPEGDLYTLAGLLCELSLREQGWEVVNLGANLPLAGLGRAVLAHRPRMVWLSVHHLDCPERFLQDFDNFRLAIGSTDAAVILGGPALGPELRSRLVAAVFGDRLAHLAAFARGLRPDPGPPRGPGSAH